jgi:hypothetical protein
MEDIEGTGFGKRKKFYDMVLRSRNSLNIFFIIPIFLGLIFSPIFFPFQTAQAGNLPTSVKVTITGPVCGNGVVESREQCDAGGSNGACPAACSTSCTTNSCGGGGGGGGYVPPPEVTKVVIQGKAYPGAVVNIIQDGKTIKSLPADAQANFRVEISDITPGIWTFSLWAEDKEGRKSITFSFTFTVISGVTTTISGIFIPPTIELERVNLARGETLGILGQTAPESEISIHIESPQEIVKKTIADEKGNWKDLFDTSSLEEGMHTTRAKAESPEGLSSSYSKVLAFYIGKYGATEICPKADFNKDGKTNLIDFSILLYWWGRANACADQNGNGKVDLPDFSIMMYWWTG